MHILAAELITIWYIQHQNRNKVKRAIEIKEIATKYKIRDTIFEPASPFIVDGPKPEIKSGECILCI